MRRVLGVIQLQRGFRAPPYRGFWEDAPGAPLLDARGNAGAQNVAQRGRFLGCQANAGKAEGKSCTECRFQPSRSGLKAARHTIKLPPMLEAPKRLKTALFGTVFYFPQANLGALAIWERDDIGSAPKIIGESVL